MKKFTIYLAVALVALPAITQAKVWRVNNNAAVVADFTTLDDALTASYANGDTIYLEPSATAYTATGNYIYGGTNTIVTIVGNGYNLDKHPGLQQDTMRSMIRSTSSNILVRSFIKFIGIVFNSAISMSPLIDVSNNYYPIDNVFFESCNFKNDVSYSTSFAYAHSIKSLHFTKNLCEGAVKIITTSPVTTTDFLFENNILFGNLETGSLVQNTGDVKQRIIRNNVIAAAFNCNYAYLANNIFPNYNENVSGVTITSPVSNCFLKNNIFRLRRAENISSVEINNLYSIDMTTVFRTDGGTVEKVYQLSAGSPAIGAGIPNGSTPVDCGAFGGPNPYKLSGIPAIPAIYELQVPLAASPLTDMLINLKARSNN